MKNLAEIDKFEHYLPNIILLWLIILIYQKSDYYTNFLRPETQTTLFCIAIIYTIIGLFYYLLIPKEKIKPSKGTIIFTALKRILRWIYYTARYFNIKKIKSPRIKKQEKITALFILVKIFFLPIMINFSFNNLNVIKNQIPNLFSNSLFSIQAFNLILFPFLLTAIFLIDTLWFSFGYMAEASFLKNTIRSVEPTFLGWIVALACYPPFNGIITKSIGWSANDYVLFSNEIITFIIRTLIILSLLIYISATLALGAKSSNLTNRGIASRGPYAIIRHPAYISKNIAWWLTIIPIASIPTILTMSAWSFIYHLRTITEEKHLSKDPDYIEYKKKVRYKYFPGVY